MRIQAFAMGLALALATVGGARADDVRFTISGGGRTAPLSSCLWARRRMAHSAIPDFSFNIMSVSAVVGGSPTTLANVTFYSAQWAAADSLRTVYSIFPASNFIRARKPAQRLLPAPISCSTLATRKTDDGDGDGAVHGSPSRSAHRQHPRAVHMGDAVARLRGPGLCRLQKGEDARHQLVQFIVPADGAGAVHARCRACSTLEYRSRSFDRDCSTCVPIPCPLCKSRSKSKIRAAVTIESADRPSRAPPQPPPDQVSPRTPPCS